MLGFDQQQMADVVGVSRYTVVQCELGNLRCAADTATSYLRGCLSLGIAFVGPNIPYEMRAPEDQISTTYGDGVYAIELNERWTVDDVIGGEILQPRVAPEPNAIVQLTRSALPDNKLPADALSLKFDGVSVSGQFTCQTQAEIDAVIRALTAQRALLQQ